MPRGYPDYANPLYSLASRNLDFGTLETASIGVPSVDGRGRILWWENWREGIYAWERLPTSGDRLAYIHTNKAFIPPACCRLPAQATGVTQASQIARRGYHNFAMSIGLEFSVSYDVEDAHVRVASWYDTLTDTYNAELKLETETDSIYLADGVAWNLITTVATPSDPETWLRIKMVINAQTGYYERLIVGQIEYDVSSIPLPIGSGVDPGHYRAIIQARCDTAPIPTIDIGHVIYTIDEP
jgi:hypothetical protein